MLSSNLFVASTSAARDAKLASEWHQYSLPLQALLYQLGRVNDLLGPLLYLLIAFGSDKLSKVHESGSNRTSMENYGWLI